MATITYKCPNCDGGLLFDPSTQKYHCEYCQSSFSQEELDALAPAAASDTAVPAGMEAEGALGGGAAGPEEEEPKPRRHFPAKLPVNRRRLRTVMRRMRLTRAMRCSTPAPAAARRS